MKGVIALNDFLKHLPKIDIPYGIHMFLVSNDFGLTRDEFIEALEEQGYIVSAAGSIIAFHKSEEKVRALEEGGEYGLITRDNSRD